MATTSRIRNVRGTKAQRQNSTETISKGQIFVETDTNLLYTSKTDATKELNSAYPVNGYNCVNKVNDDATLGATTTGATYKLIATSYDNIESITTGTYTIDFTDAAGNSWSQIEIVTDTEIMSLFWIKFVTSDNVKMTVAYQHGDNNTITWYGECYKTLTFATAPTGALLTWLNETTGTPAQPKNAVLVSSPRAVGTMIDDDTNLINNALTASRFYVVTTPPVQSPPEGTVIIYIGSDAPTLSSRLPRVLYFVVSSTVT